MIEFVTDTEKGFTFGDVEDNQFFMDESGNRCQKVTDSSYNILAEFGGKPFAAHVTGISFYTPVMIVFDKATKVAFG